MRKQYTTEEKQNLVAMFKNGSQTITAFAQANGINPLTFRSWLYVKKRQVVKKETTGFVEIETPVRIAEKNIKIQKDGIEILLPVIEDFISRKKITESIEFLLILTDNMSILLLEVPLCYVNLQLQTIGGSSTKLSGI